MSTNKARLSYFASRNFSQWIGPWKELTRESTLQRGKVHILETTEILKERHGYDTGFFNRYDLLCVLHKHIREKERLLVNQKVVRIDTYEDRVVVQTAAGNVFEAQMIVGADGVRSTVRKEMWRNAELVGAVPEEDKKGQSSGLRPLPRHIHS